MTKQEVRKVCFRHKIRNRGGGVSPVPGETKTGTRRAGDIHKDGTEANPGPCDLAHLHFGSLRSRLNWTGETRDRHATFSEPGRECSTATSAAFVRVALSQPLRAVDFGAGMTSCVWPRLFLFVCALTSVAATKEPAGCKIRFTARGLDMLKWETLKFVEEELSNISMPEMSGKEGSFQYTITDVKITELNLTHADLSFLPDEGLMLDIQNSSIALSFRRRLLYWFLSDTGDIEASADGVDVNTGLGLGRDPLGRLRINDVTCRTKIAKMRTKFGGTLGKVYDFLAKFLTTGMRFLLNKRICPALRHAALADVNSMLETIPVRTEVDSYIGIDYSLTEDPLVTSRSLDMNFRGMFFHLADERDTLVNSAAEPLIRDYERMVYLALSEYFFDSGLFSYYKAGIFQMNLTNDNMPKDLEMLLRTTYFGTIMMLNPALMDSPVSLELAVNAPPATTIRTSGASVVMTAVAEVAMTPAGRPPEGKFNAKVSIREKRLSVLADLRRFKIFSNRSALESLALIPLQAPLKTMLQMSVVPLINNWTKRGVRIPLADGMELVEDVVEYHDGFIVIGANLRFSKGLREMAAAAAAPQ
ncbi:phospholipid transfer protein isoform X2 [Syngnathoides biaculeatus]|uniref:phospholipid transfer protein isoform X2 n=1 Tax=Syngnathoides biaculeatus TaxID=300417 RepID=UPI002ADD448D|nr:phospholipid transfer protein isoform X2 [Syngnathoides biaculeatus]